MKKYAYILSALLLVSGLQACDQDHKPDWTETAPFDVKVVSTSIADGQEVSPEVVTITVTYDCDIALNSQADITLNGLPVSNPRVVDGKTLVADFHLERGKRYIFNIPADAVAGIGSKTFAPQLTVNFNTGTINIIDKTKLSPALVNAAASPEAKAVYDLLVNNYGNRQLSGAMGGVAWETVYTDYIFEQTGKYPAIVGFDYIHLASSPADWIDYGDIEPVKKAWEAGSIPAMTWHWNVPIAEGSDVLSFSTTVTVDGKEVENQFKASEVLVEGTWENKVATADVEKLAGYLKLLKDANIPVLWRPFHEAAGDYTWGAWFWWGNSGTETTKQLWNWLREKLVKEHGLDNLIWVWTAQTSDEGKLADLSKLQEAYPGDESVDIVGADLYVDPLSDQLGSFELLYNLTGGRKLVALAECGNLLDVDTAFADGALWSYFMAWYEMEDGKPVAGQWNLNGEWKKVLGNPLVLNRGDLKF